MKKDLDIMIKLQQLWDKVLDSKREIERNKKNIFSGDAKVEKEKQIISADEKEIKKQKVSIDEQDNELAQKDEHAKKLDERKTQITTEKELTAIENELATINGERGVMEEELIQALDALAEKEKKLRLVKSSHEELIEKVAKDNNNSKEKINKAQDIESANASDFEKLIPDLGKAYQSKFSERLSSLGGKAIAAIENGNCVACHFVIPVHLAKAARDENKIHLCTNCSRFIYQKN